MLSVATVQVQDVSIVKKRLRSVASEAGVFRGDDESKEAMKISGAQHLRTDSTEWNWLDGSE